MIWPTVFRGCPSSAITTIRPTNHLPPRRVRRCPEACSSLWRFPQAFAIRQVPLRQNASRPKAYRTRVLHTTIALATVGVVTGNHRADAEKLHDEAQLSNCTYYSGREHTTIPAALGSDMLLPSPAQLSPQQLTLITTFIRPKHHGPCDNVPVARARLIQAVKAGTQNKRSSQPRRLQHGLRPRSRAYCRSDRIGLLMIDPEHRTLHQHRERLTRRTPAKHLGTRTRAPSQLQHQLSCVAPHHALLRESTSSRSSMCVNTLDRDPPIPGLPRMLDQLSNSATEHHHRARHRCGRRRRNPFQQAMAFLATVALRRLVEARPRHVAMKLLMYRAARGRLESVSAPYEVRLRREMPVPRSRAVAGLSAPITEALDRRGVCSVCSSSEAPRIKTSLRIHRRTRLAMISRGGPTQNRRGWHP